MSDELTHEPVETLESAEETPVSEVLDSGEGVEASSSEPPDETSEASASSTTSRPRDEFGRFAKADPAVSQAEGSQDSQGLEAQSPDAQPTAPTPAVNYRPVALKVDGQMIELPGAGQREDGIIEMQPQAFEEVHRWMGKGIVSERKLGALQEQLRELQEQKSLREQEVEAIGEMYAQMALLDDEQLFEVLQGFRQELPALRERLRADHLQRELERRERASRPDPRQEQETLRASYISAFNEEWESAVRNPEVKGLSPEDHAQIRAELEAVWDSFLFRAPEDDPAREIRRGEYLFDEVKFHQLFATKARYLAGLRQTQAQVQAARVQNATKQAPAPVATRQGAPRVATPSQTAQAAKPRPKSREDWMREMFDKR